jgi:hypothetical protein
MYDHYDGCWVIFVSVMEMINMMMMMTTEYNDDDDDDC